MVAVGDRLTLRIEKWVQNGYCLAHEPNGRPVFVHGALPGETVELRIQKAVESHSFATTERIVESAPERQDPSCSLFPRCGGCSFRHLEREAELQLKRTLLDEFDALATCFAEAAPRAFAGPPDGYRNHLQLHGGPNGPGYFEPFSNRSLPLPPEGCALAPPQLLDWIATHPGEGKKLVYRLHQDQAHGPLQAEDPPLQEIIALDDDHSFSIEFGPLGFFQVNRYLIPAWLQELRRLVPPGQPTSCELYCGAGLIACALRDLLGEYEGFEISSEALHYARRNFKRLGLSGKFYAQDLDRQPAPLGGAPRLLLVNPPRAGIGRAQMDVILQRRPKRLIYSSCNPASLNRDLRRLRQAGYRASGSAWFDFFPRTPHVETLLALDIPS
ncbi:MAG: TRAM domain-containing protein [Leptospirales bacterium]|nr:TRAM domain-containing protein [Leptospirales bacterium]